ncbi:hypothetical protein MBLNU457_5099t2 [Dothideomycetes sp. NU457]
MSDVFVEPDENMLQTSDLSEDCDSDHNHSPVDYDVMEDIIYDSMDDSSSDTIDVANSEATDEDEDDTMSEALEAVKVNTIAAFYLAMEQWPLNRLTSSEREAILDLVLAKLDGAEFRFPDATACEGLPDLLKRIKADPEWYRTYNALIAIGAPPYPIDCFW